MFEEVKDQIGQKIDEFCQQNELPTGKANFVVMPLPFSGEWGMAALLFPPLAAADPNKTGPVPQHAQVLAENQGSGWSAWRFHALGSDKRLSELYFDTSLYASSVVDQINTQDSKFATLIRLISW